MIASEPRRARSNEARGDWEAESSVADLARWARDVGTTGVSNAHSIATADLSLRAGYLWASWIVGNANSVLAGFSKSAWGGGAGCVSYTYPTAADLARRAWQKRADCRDADCTHAVEPTRARSEKAEDLRDAISSIVASIPRRARHEGTSIQRQADASIAE